VSQHTEGRSSTLLSYTTESTTERDEAAEELREEITEQEKQKARKRIAKNEAADLDVGDVVRLSTYQTDRLVRKAVKRNEYKKVTVRWTTQKYIIFKRYRSLQATQKTSYCLVTEQGEPLPDQ
jgi:hypothetical protein